MPAFTERTRLVTQVMPPKPAGLNRSAAPDAAKLNKLLAGITDLVAGKSPKEALQLLRRLRLQLLEREGYYQVAALQRQIESEA